MDYGQYKRELQAAIETKAACSAQYLQTQPLTFAVDGRVRWKGKVEIYQLKNHPQAKLAFGWGYKSKGGKIAYVTVMGIPPLDSPTAAVRAFVASNIDGSQ